VGFFDPRDDVGVDEDEFVVVDGEHGCSSGRQSCVDGADHAPRVDGVVAVPDRRPVRVKRLLARRSGVLRIVSR
jgi:hypothetical protein